MKPMRKASRQQDAGWALEVFDRAPYVTVVCVGLTELHMVCRFHL